MSKNNFVFLLLFLCLSLAVNVYQATTAAAAYDESEVELDAFSKQYENINLLYRESLLLVEEFKADNNQLSDDLIKQLDELKKVKADIEQIKSTAANKDLKLKALAIKYEKIVSLNKKLEDKIDEILLENKVLFEKNDSLEEDVQMLTKEKSSLDKMISVGSKIKAEYFKTISFKKRPSGKYKETIAAKRTARIDVSFSLLENPLSDKGEKTVYLRIIAPNGVELGNPSMGSDFFVADGVKEQIKFSVKKVFTYTGSAQEMIISYEEDPDVIQLEKGRYEVEVYLNSYVSGSSSFQLK